MKKIILFLILPMLFITRAYAVEVQLLTPSEGDMGVYIDSEISVSFDGPIGIIDAEGVTITPEVKNVKVIAEGATLTILHDDFEPSTTYTITIPEGVVEGYNHFRISWSFTTRDDYEGSYMGL